MSVIILLYPCLLFGTGLYLILLRLFIMEWLQLSSPAPLYRYSISYFVLCFLGIVAWFAQSLVFLAILFIISLIMTMHLAYFIYKHIT